MAKNSGSTRATNSKTASESRTRFDMTRYISDKVEEIDSFKMPRKNDFEYISIKGQNYRVVRLTSGYKEHISLRDKENKVLTEYQHTGDKYTKNDNWKKLAMARVRNQLHKILSEN